MEIVTWVSMGGLTVSAALCVLRVVRARTITDRVLALDTLLIVIVVGVAVGAAQTGAGTYLDVLLLVALVAFVGTTAVGRFIERRGAR